MSVFYYEWKKLMIFQRGLLHILAALVADRFHSKDLLLHSDVLHPMRKAPQRSRKCSWYRSWAKADTSSRRSW